MNALFKGTQRKLGCLLLVIVLPLLLGWVRSVSQADFIGLFNRGSTFSVVSHGGMLNFERSTPLSPVHPTLNSTNGLIGRRKSVITVTQPLISKSPRLFWGTQRLTWFNEMIGVRTRTVDVEWSDFDVEWQRRLGEMELVAGNDGIHQAGKLVIPYWLVVLPLALVSSFLILKKPRKECRKRTIEPSRTEFV